MKRRSILRRSRLPRAVLALPLLAAPVAGAGIAYAASPSSANGTQNSIQINVKDRRVPYGQELTVQGSAPASEKGQHVVLEFQRAGGSHWSRISQATVGNHSDFRFTSRVRLSGRIKVIGQWEARRAISPAAATAAPPTSGSRRVTVFASLDLGHHASNDYGDHVITVPGQLRPTRAGRQVRLQVQTGGHWHTGAVAHTGSQGRFHLRFTPHSSWQRLRVRFGGDRTNAGTGARAGTVTVFNQEVASWYEDGGATACGYHASYGVANLRLPCGTKVKFAYHGRTVTATVDDRGPYVGGREWDLNQNTAGALGFDGVGAVWSSR